MSNSERFLTGCGAGLVLLTFLFIIGLLAWAITSIISMATLSLLNSFGLLMKYEFGGVNDLPHLVTVLVMLFVGGLCGLINMTVD